MDLKVVLAFLFYWFVLTALYTQVILPTAAHPIATNATSINTSWSSPGGNLTVTEDTGSSSLLGRIGNALNNVGNILGFLIVGVGLPSDTPVWFQFMFSGIIIMLNIILAVLLINSFWSGGGK